MLKIATEMARILTSLLIERTIRIVVFTITTEFEKKIIIVLAWVVIK